jgi:hypothetical protein
LIRNKQQLEYQIDEVMECGDYFNGFLQPDKRSLDHFFQYIYRYIYIYKKCIQKQMIRDGHIVFKFLRATIERLRARELT